MVSVKKTDGEASVMPIQVVQAEFYIVGTKPLVLHAMSAKSKEHLLFPPRKKNQAEKDSTMKHNPLQEFRDAAYKFRDDEAPTRLYMPGAAFHSAMAAAALDMAGANKSQIGRLTSVSEEKVPLFGIPQVWSTIVRSSDMARTPDVRTLPILRRWAAKVTVDYVGSLIKTASIVNLMGAAGHIVGIGDGRPQKGKLAFGKFRICDYDDEEFVAIIKEGTRPAQDRALANPATYDVETEELLSWFDAEVKTRHASPTRIAVKKDTNGGDPVGPTKARTRARAEAEA